jgi:uncharacterized protein (TIGR00297 family)
VEVEQLSLVLFVGIATIAAYVLGHLSLSGSVAAFITGFSILLGYGMNGLLLLGVFFITSSLLSKYKRKHKEFLGEVHEKGSTRDWEQVAANGGIAALASLAQFLFPNPVWLIAFSISLASANADTWASELGTLSKKRPVSLKNLQRVPQGTSGAISGIGTLASAGGAMIIALSFYILFGFEWNSAVVIFVFGLVGTMIDSLFGALFQEQYKCKCCSLQTEKTVHCSVRTEKISGIVWMNNDAVNFLSCFIATLMGIIIYMVLL